MSGRSGLAVLLAALGVAVAVAAVFLLPRLGVLGGFVGVMVVLHVLFYLAVGILLLTLAPRQAERVRAFLKRWRRPWRPHRPEPHS